MKEAFKDFLEGKITMDELLEIGERYDEEYEKCKNKIEVNESEGN